MLKLIGDGSPHPVFQVHHGCATCFPRRQSPPHAYLLRWCVPLEERFSCLMAGVIHQKWVRLSQCKTPYSKNSPAIVPSEKMISFLSPARRTSEDNTIHVDILRLNTLQPTQNGRHFADNTFKRIFLNESARISIKISLKFVPEGTINNIPALVQIMAWRRPGDKPLSEPMVVRFLAHICITHVPILVTQVSHNSYRPSDTYRQVSNIRRTLVGIKIVDNSDVVGASPVGAVPTTSSLST